MKVIPMISGIMIEQALDQEPCIVIGLRDVAR